MALSFSFVSCSSDGDEEVSGGDYKSGIYVINGHKFVDLGLPSGILWAETNVGAETAADDGNYYAWGETKPKSSDTSENYTYNGIKNVLDKSADAAYVNWGSPCRMPTKTEFAELCNTDNCTWTWTSKTNSSNETINGYEVTSKTNGNSIFLPASGCRNGSSLRHYGSSGRYWSSTLYYLDTSDAYHLFFSSDYFSSDYFYCYLGFTVRPVAER